MEASALQAPVGITRLSLGGSLLRLRSDEQLVAQFRAGNDDAFRVLHDRYRPRLLAYARQMLGGSRQDAEDATQDVFIRAYRALRESDRPVAVRGWLYRVAHNRCIDLLRRPAPAPADLFDIARPPAPDPAAETERREDLRRLVTDVRRLPPAQRSVLLMRELEGLSYAELAAALGTSVPAVKSLLVRARSGLVEAINARDAACDDIRRDLALAHGRGVRANGRARRHLRDCPGCREYRQQVRHLQRSFAALSPGVAAPAGLLAKLGIGGSGGGAAASGGAVAGGGGAASSVVGGGAATLTVSKMAVVVCSMVVTAGGAATVERELVGSEHSGSAPVTRPVQAAPAPAAAPGQTALPVTEVSAKQPIAADELLTPSTLDQSGATAADDAAPVLTSGGTAAPDEAPPAPVDAPAASSPADDALAPPPGDGVGSEPPVAATPATPATPPTETPPAGDPGGPPGTTP